MRCNVHIVDFYAYKKSGTHQGICVPDYELEHSYKLTVTRETAGRKQLQHVRVGTESTNPSPHRR